MSHLRAVLELMLALVPFVRKRRLGEVLIAPMDVVLDFDNALVVQPDLLFVSSDRVPRDTPFSATTPTSRLAQNIVIRQAD